SSVSFADEERNAIGAAIARTPILLLPDSTVGITAIKSFVTVEGQPPVGQAPSGETSFPPLAVVAIVALCAAAAAYIAHEISAVVASNNFNNNKTQRMLEAQAGALDVVSKHAEQEKSAGKALPYSDEERKLLEHLETVQRDVAAEKQVPLPSPF